MKNLICALIATTSLFACAADDPAPAASCGDRVSGQFAPRPARRAG